MRIKVGGLVSQYPVLIPYISEVSLFLYTIHAGFCPVLFVLPNLLYPVGYTPWPLLSWFDIEALIIDFLNTLGLCRVCVYLIIPLAHSQQIHLSGYSVIGKPCFINKLMAIDVLPNNDIAYEDSRVSREPEVKAVNPVPIGEFIHLVKEGIDQPLDFSNKSQAINVPPVGVFISIPFDVGHHFGRYDI
ncbi:MAG: hypothetical protein DDT33_01747 [Firmicutes bacterium]|nr:hypothetical protein [Bacillota bacterium]